MSHGIPDKTEIASFIDRVSLLYITISYNAGSVLLHSLFDGHPQVIAFPRLWGWYNRIYENLDQAIHDGDRAMVDRIINSGLLVPYAPTDPDIPVGEERYSEILLRLFEVYPPTRRRELVALYHLGLALVLGYDTEAIRYVMIHDHTPGGSLFDAIEADFPSPKILMPVRDPRQACVGPIAQSPRLFLRKTLFKGQSLIKNLRKATRDPMDSTGSQSQGGAGPQTFLLPLRKAHSLLWMTLSPRARATAFCAQLNHDALGFFLSHENDDIRVTDLNRLHADGPGCMRKICEWLSIDFDDGLLRSTFLGNTWWGNSSDQQKLSGFEPARAKYNFQDKLPVSYRRELEHFSAHMIRYFGLPAPDSTMPTEKETKRWARLYDRLFKLAQWYSYKATVTDILALDRKFADRTVSPAIVV